MKKMVNIMLTVFCCLLMLCSLNACEGTASSSGGEEPGNSGNPSDNNNGDDPVVNPTDLNFRFSGYDQPVNFYCHSLDISWEAIPLEVNGNTVRQIKNLPQDVECNVTLAPDVWAVNADGVCQDYHFYVNETEITTWKENQYGGRNYSFRVNTSGQIELTGSNIVFVDCSSSGDPGCQVSDQEIVFTGHQLGDTVTLFCVGEGLGWEAITLPTNGQTNLSVCPGLFECSVAINGSYAVREEGLCDQYTLTVNGTTITTGVAGVSGGKNYSFEILTDGSVQLWGDTLPLIDCSATSGDTMSCLEPQELNFELIGDSTGDTTMLYCTGSGLGWGNTSLDENDQAALSGCPGPFECNLEVSPGNWVVRSDGVCQTYTLLVNGTTITTGVQSISGGQNYSFELLADGTVQAWGNTLELIDCSGNSSNPGIFCDLEFIYQGTYQDPILKLTGGGVSWDTDYHFTLAGDTMSLLIEDVHPDTYYSNMDMLGNGSLWYVNYQGILTGNSLYANGTLLDYTEANGAGGANLVFTLDDACQVVLPGDTTQLDIIIDL